VVAFIWSGGRARSSPSGQEIPSRNRLGNDKDEESVNAGDEAIFHAHDSLFTLEEESVNTDDEAELCLPCLEYCVVAGIGLSHSSSYCIVAGDGVP
jgi:hypothetical protein